MSKARRFLAGALVAWAAGAAAADPTPPAGSGQGYVRPLPTLDGLAARVDQLEEQSKNQGLLSLLNQVEALKADVARLKGAQDEFDNRLQAAEKRQKEVLADFDARLKEVQELASKPAPAPVAAPVPAAPPAGAGAPAQPAADPEVETKAYEAALNQFKGTDYAGAVSAFNAFLGKYPNSPLAGNAAYWLGLTYFAMGDHKNAISAQQHLLKTYPQHPKVPDGMVSMARAQIQLGQTEEARHTLDDVIRLYPNTRSAELAKKILLLFK